MKNVGLLILALLTASSAFASSGTRKNIDLTQDFDTLGDNAAIVERARKMDPHNRVDIVQNRLVDRNMRLELGVTGGVVAGGDAYYNSQNLGGTMDFHINPKWSIGARYYHSFNQLTPEGQSVYDNAQARYNVGDTNYQVPDIDYPIETGLVTASWYPIYGKLGGFDQVAHFDLYTLVGYGKTETANAGWNDTYAVGGGVGLWFTQHFATRLEARYQTYEDQVYSARRRMNTGVIMASVGFLL